MISIFKVDVKNQLRYWICAFCINQHASICGSSMGVLDTVTQEVLPCCDCATPKSLGEPGAVLVQLYSIHGYVVKDIYRCFQK